MPLARKEAGETIHFNSMEVLLAMREHIRSRLPRQVSKVCTVGGGGMALRRNSIIYTHVGMGRKLFETIS